MHKTPAKLPLNLVTVVITYPQNKISSVKLWIKYARNKKKKGPKEKELLEEISTKPDNQWQI
ncbi:hypothetical protein HK333_07535 [Streptococcus agalactiae]|nr:hypothetical protein [Streptococcus agalactiae]